MRTHFYFSHRMLSGLLICLIFALTGCGGGSSGGGGGGAVAIAGPSDLRAEGRYSQTVWLFWTEAELQGDILEVVRSTDQVNYDLVYTSGIDPVPNDPEAADYIDQVPSAEQTYYYKIRGRFVDPTANGTEFSEYSNVSIATTLAAPSGLTSTAVSQTEIDLHWSDNSNLEDGFEIGRTSAQQYGVIEPIGQVGANMLTYRDSNLSPGIEYIYVVRAINNGGHVSSSSNVAQTVIPIYPWAHSFGGVADDTANTLSWGGDSLTYPTGPAAGNKTIWGGFILAGETQSFGAGDSDFWVLKTDHNGSLLWQKAYGKSAKESVVCSIPGWTGGHIIAGNTESFGAGLQDVWLMNLDQEGNIFWQKAFGSSESDQVKDMISFVNPTSGPSYIVAGETRSAGLGESDIWLFGLNTVGQFSWQRAIGGPGEDTAQSIISVKNSLGEDGGYLVLGNTTSVGFGDSDFLFVHLDPFGNTAGLVVLGGINKDYAHSAQQISDLGFIVAGETLSAGAGSYDGLLIRLDTNGVPVWEKTIGGTASDRLVAVLETEDNGFLVAGETASFGTGDSDAWLIKLTDQGEVVWEFAYGGPGPDTINAITDVADGGFVVAGESASFSAGGNDIWAFKVSEDGTIDFSSGSTAKVTQTQAIVQSAPAMLYSVTSLTEMPTAATSVYTDADVADTQCTILTQTE